MRKLILAGFLLLISTGLLAQTAPVPSAAYAHQLQARYPLKPSSLHANCVEWDNPYFSAIIDTSLRQSLVTYAYYTPAREDSAVLLHVERSHYGAWHAYVGMENETKFYTDINRGISSTLLKYDKGHYAAFELCAWSYDGAILSCTYDLNEGIELQGQNEGTEAEVESLTRLLVGSTAAQPHMKVHYDGPTFSRVDYWKGSWGSKQMFTMDGITKNYSAVYWNLLQYGREAHAYWFPNDMTAKKGYTQFEIPVAELISRLGFDPRQALPAQ
jgi:hypothetical protein